MGRRQIGVVGCPVCFIVIDVEIEPVVGVRTIELDVTQLECCALGANYQPFIEVVGALCASGAGSRRSAVGPKFVCTFRYFRGCANLVKLWVSAGSRLVSAVNEKLILP